MILTLGTPTSRVISYSSVLLFVGGLAITGYGLTSKTSRGRKHILMSITVLIVLGWFDGIVMKESVFQNIQLGMGVASIIV